MTDFFFYLPDLISMLVSYENSKKKIPYQFFFPAFEGYKKCRISLPVGARQETGEIRAAGRQYRKASVADSLFLSCFILDI